MIDSEIMLGDGESRSIRGGAEGRRAFVTPMASVHGELGVLTLQSRHPCEHAHCHHTGKRHHF